MRTSIKIRARTYFTCGVSVHVQYREKTKRFIKYARAYKITDARKYMGTPIISGNRHFTSDDFYLENEMFIKYARAHKLRAVLRIEKDETCNLVAD